MGRGGKNFEAHAKNMGLKGSSSEVSDRNVECIIIGNGGKAVHVIKWQRTWLNFILMFYGS